MVLFQIDFLRYHRLAKEGSWIVLGQIASILGAVVLVRVLTDRLPPSQYGELALGMTVAGLVNQVVMGGLGQGIGRFYSVSVEKHDLSGYLSASRRLMIYASFAVVLMGVLVIFCLLLLGASRWVGLAGAAVLFALLSSYNSTLNGVQNAARQRAVVAFHGGLNAWLKILLVVGLLAWLGTSSTVVMVGYALSSLVVTASQFLFLRKTIATGAAASGRDVNWQKEIWTYSWPFATWGLFSWAQIASDRWALQAFTGTQEVGLYAVLYQLGYYPISLCTGMVMQFLAPIFYQRSGDATDPQRNAGVHKAVRRITGITLAVTAFACLLGFFFHDLIFRILVSRRYDQISHLLPWMLLAGGLFAAGQTISLKLMSDMKTRIMAPVKIITALCGVAFHFVGAYCYGVAGVVVGGISFAVLYFSCMMILSGRSRTFTVFDHHKTDCTQSPVASGQTITA